MVVTARFIVPKPPLVLDTQRVVDPGNYGFEVVDAAGERIPIVRVEVTGPTAVSVTLSTTAPVASRLRYAFTGVPHTCPGRARGPRGNLRDSDDTASNHAYNLANWALHFDVPIE